MKKTIGRYNSLSPLFSLEILTVFIPLVCNKYVSLAPKVLAIWYTPRRHSLPFSSCWNVCIHFFVTVLRIMVSEAISIEVLGKTALRITQNLYKSCVKSEYLPILPCETDIQSSTHYHQPLVSPHRTQWLFPKASVSDVKSSQSR